MSISFQNRVGGNCPYCMSPIIATDNQVNCPGCEVSHHSDCWQENGGCTTLGCNGESINNVDQDIGYTFDDLSQEYSADKLVINIEDLGDDQLERTAYSGMAASDSANTGVSSYSAGSVGSLVFAGLLGSFLTWWLSLDIFYFEQYADYTQFDRVLQDLVGFSAVMGGIIGMILGAVEGVSGRVTSKALSGMFKGLIIGVTGAAFGAFIGQHVFVALGGLETEDIASFATLRSIYWGLVGLFIGYAHGISSGGGDRAKNGLIGGLIGGAVGGLLFEIFFQTFEEASLSAFVAIMVFGLCIGLSIGLVQEYRKQAWLRVLNGPTAGKEYIVQGAKTTIGSSPKCHIVLVRDPGIEHHHANINFNGNQYNIASVAGLNNISVNNSFIRRTNIKDGNRIRIGGYDLMFHERALRKNS